MIVEKLKIDGFGKLHDLNLEFSGGLNLIYGPNEAGKTTLLSSLIALLAWTPSELKKIQNYKPWSSGQEFKAETLVSINNRKFLFKGFFNEEKRELSDISGQEPLIIKDSDLNAILDISPEYLKLMIYNDHISVNELDKPFVKESGLKILSFTKPGADENNEKNGLILLEKKISDLGNNSLTYTALGNLFEEINKLKQELQKSVLHLENFTSLKQEIADKTRQQHTLSQLKTRYEKFLSYSQKETIFKGLCELYSLLEKQKIYTLQFKHLGQYRNLNSQLFEEYLLLSNEENKLADLKRGLDDRAIELVEKVSRKYEELPDKEIFRVLDNKKLFKLQEIKIDFKNILKDSDNEAKICSEYKDKINLLKGKLDTLSQKYIRIDSILNLQRDDYKKIQYFKNKILSFEEKTASLNSEMMNEQRLIENTTENLRHYFSKKEASLNLSNSAQYNKLIILYDRYSATSSDKLALSSEKDQLTKKLNDINTENQSICKNLLKCADEKIYNKVDLYKIIELVEESLKIRLEEEELNTLLQNKSWEATKLSEQLNFLQSEVRFLPNADEADNILASTTQSWEKYKIKMDEFKNLTTSFDNQVQKRNEITAKLADFPEFIKTSSEKELEQKLDFYEKSKYEKIHHKVDARGRIHKLKKQYRNSKTSGFLALMPLLPSSVVYFYLINGNQFIKGSNYLDFSINTLFVLIFILLSFSKHRKAHLLKKEISEQGKAYGAVIRDISKNTKEIAGVLSIEGLRTVSNIRKSFVTFSNLKGELSEINKTIEFKARERELFDEDLSILRNLLKKTLKNFTEEAFREFQIQFKNELRLVNEIDKLNFFINQLDSEINDLKSKKEESGKKNLEIRDYFEKNEILDLYTSLMEEITGNAKNKIGKSLKEEAVIINNNNSRKNDLSNRLNELSLRKDSLETRETQLIKEISEILGLKNSELPRQMILEKAKNAIEGNDYYNSYFRKKNDLLDGAIEINNRIQRARVSLLSLQTEKKLLKLEFSKIFERYLPDFEENKDEELLVTIGKLENGIEGFHEIRFQIDKTKKDIEYYDSIFQQALSKVEFNREKLQMIKEELSFLTGEVVPDENILEAIEKYEMNFYRSREIKKEIEEFEQNLQEANAKLKELNLRSEELREKKNRLLKKESIRDLNEFQQKYKYWRTLVDLQADMRTCEEKIGSFEKPEILERILSEISDTSRTSLENDSELSEFSFKEISEKAFQINNELNDLTKEIARKNYLLEEKSRIHFRYPVDIKDELSLKQREYDKLIRFREALTLAKNIIEEEADNIKKNISPAIELYASDYFRLFTKGRYKGISLEKNLEINALSVIDNRRIALSNLSSSTLYQLLFSIKLAIMKLFRKNNVMYPLILDDPFFNMDDERTKIIGDFLIALSRETQVIFSSANSRYPEYFKENQTIKNIFLS